MNNHESIMFYAFRYALGRRTYATSDVSSYLIEHWKELNTITRVLIHKEIKEAIKNDVAGMNCDITSWKKLLLLSDKKQEVK